MMNPLDWDAFLRIVHKNADPKHQNYVNNSMENAQVTNNEMDTFGASKVSQSSMGWDGVSPPLSLNLNIEDSEVEDPDGAPIELEEEDPELLRKRKELREIEERILFKKAAIALKTVETSVKKTSLSDLSCNEQSSACKGATLKDRVNVILQQGHPAGFLSKVRSPRERINSSRLSRDGLLQDDHPLKLRVKALMKHRCSDPCVLPASREATDVPPPPPSRRDTSPAKQENGVNEGFQLFLNVLNKGVDFDFLSRIVTNDSEDLPLGEELLNVHHTAAENKSDPPFGNDSQQLSSGVSLPDYSRTNSRESKTDPPSQERSLNKTLPDDGEKKDDRGDCCFISNSRSRSTSAGKNKKMSKEETPRLDEQSAQLQNILKTLGLSLEVEEMSKLADRTQERLYGKKHGARRADHKGEQESQQRGSQRYYSHSSSSSSRSTRSRTFSPSLSRRQCSHSKDSERRSERSHSRDKSRDGPTQQDHYGDGREEQSYRDEDRDGKYLKEISAYQHPDPPNPTYPQPHPSAFSEFSANSLSQYTVYQSTYSTATNSYWTHTQDAIPPFFYPSEGPYPQNTYCPFPGSFMAPNMFNRRCRSHKDMNLIFNPDLSQSEGQSGSVSRPRCLQVVKTKTNESNLKQLITHKSRSGMRSLLKKKRKQKLKHRKKQRAQKLAAKREKLMLEKALKVDKDDLETESEEEKQLPTETEIKANLKKTLNAFNQKVRQKMPQPAICLTSQID
ncbi:zinc finger protein 318-like [Etheostoma cragini]|uniref:zinc finger protein 318-like n=1 Tax=Etheostoma cragini TaxID=417921 RepID=UPI00155F1D9F|nr:zinc finger protein 318-like [Etheostoma cragini]XP_034746552.1 zinc finger protein 318-like [Etheostoma cragini]XP_034746560.1 zinc finger protein 318-like [Etheostoma cragini]XP_034746570.1 zinc finger protein 318-like [Etheostoma cragini]